MGTALCRICAGVLLLFSSFSRATEPSVDGKTYVLSCDDSNLAKALAFYAQGLYYLQETPSSAQLALAMDSLRSARALDPEALDSYFANGLPQTLMRFADVFSEAEQPDFERARAFRLEALKLDPMAYFVALLVVFPTSQSLEGLGLVEVADAVGAFAHSTELNFPFSLLRLELLVAASDWDAAAAEWEKLHAEKLLIPKSARLPQVYYLLGGSVLGQSGKTAELLNLLTAGLLTYPESDNMMNSIAYTLAVEGRELPRALELIDRALVRAPEQYAYLDTLGWVLYKMGDYDGAFRSLTHALAYAHEDNHEVYDHIGDVLVKLGREAESPIWWAKSYSLHPDPVVSEKLRAAGIDPEALP